MVGSQPLRPRRLDWGVLSLSSLRSWTGASVRTCCELFCGLELPGLGFQRFRVVNGFSVRSHHWPTYGHCIIPSFVSSVDPLIQTLRRLRSTHDLGHLTHTTYQPPEFRLLRHLRLRSDILSLEDIQDV